MKKFLPFLIAAGVFGFFEIQKLRNKLSTKIVKAKLDAAKTIESGGQLVYIATKVAITNPSNFPFTVSSIALQVLSHNVIIGTITRAQKFALPANQTTTVDLLFSVPVANLPSAVIDAVQNFIGGGGIEIQFAGRINLGLLGSLNINEPYKIL